MYIIDLLVRRRGAPDESSDEEWQILERLNQNFHPWIMAYINVVRSGPNLRMGLCLNPALGT